MHRLLAAALLASLLVPAAQAAFVEERPEEGYTARSADINAAQAAITVQRHFTVNETLQAYVWFDPWTAESVQAGYRVAFALGPADRKGAPASVLLSSSDVRNTDASPTTTLKPETEYVLQFTVTYPPLGQRSSSTNSFVGIIALKEPRSSEGSGGILDPSIGTRLDMTFTGTVAAAPPPPPPPAPRPTAPPAPKPEAVPPVPDAEPDRARTPEIRVTNEVEVPQWLVALLVLIGVLSLLGLVGRRRRPERPANPPSPAPFLLQEAGPFILRDDPFWGSGDPPKRL